MTQTKLTDLAAPQAKVYSCWTCRNKQDVQVIAGRQMVKCFGTWAAFQTGGCNVWSGGKDLKAMQACAPDPGFVPKKYAGGPQ